MSDMKKKKKRKKSRKFWLMVAELVVVIILLVVLILAIAGGGILGKMHFLDFNKEDAGINENLNEDVIKAMEGYTNIALFGLDNRQTGQIENGGNSDVIMIASINNKNKDIKLVSVYRDTTLNIGAQYGSASNQGINKANSAYAYGGYKNAVQMLNANLDLNITDFVVVDWSAVSRTIDKLGGVEITLDSSEVKYINEYIDDINRSLGTDAEHIYDAGTRELNGVQATAYCRIRYTAGNDFRRASRQRIVLEAMLNRAKKADMGTLTGIVNEIAGDISTSFELPELINLAKDVKSYNLVKTSGFPTYLNTSDMFHSCVVPLTLESNVKELHEFLFENEKYEASETVKSISETIIRLTGMDENTKTDYDVSDYNDTVGKDNAFD